MNTNINTTDLSNLRNIFKDYIPKSERNQECHDNIGIMVYPSIMDIDNGKQVSVEEVIKDIRTKTSRFSVDKKEKLPVAYFSVTNFNGNKTDINVTGHSGLIIIDIDVKDNPNTDFERLNNLLQWNPFTYASFRSPNNGIKLVIRTDIKEIGHHKAYYEAIKCHLLERNEELNTIDTSGSNVSRGCFLPCDAKAYLNQFSETFTVSQEYIDDYFNLHQLSAKHGSSPKPLLQVEYLSFDKHYENIKNVIRNWTSMGQLTNKGTLMGNGNNNNFCFAPFPKYLIL